MAFVLNQLPLSLGLSPGKLPTHHPPGEAAAPGAPKVALRGPGGLWAAPPPQILSPRAAPAGEGPGVPQQADQEPRRQPRRLPGSGLPIPAGTQAQESPPPQRPQPESLGWPLSPTLPLSPEPLPNQQHWSRRRGTRVAGPSSAHGQNADWTGAVPTATRRNPRGRAEQSKRRGVHGSELPALPAARACGQDGETAAGQAATPDSPPHGRWSSRAAHLGARTHLRRTGLRGVAARTRTLHPAIILEVGTGGLSDPRARPHPECAV